MSHTQLAIHENLEINAPETEAARPLYLCRHIFVDGRQCGSRALRGQHFCYYHYAHRTPVLANQRRRQPKSGFDLTRLDGLDNHTAIQLSLAEVLGRIAANEIDTKTAWLLLYGLQIAGQNLRHARPNPEAPIPASIIEDPAHGQLAAPEPGRTTPPSLVDNLQTLLRAEQAAALNSSSSIDRHLAPHANDLPILEEATTPSPETTDFRIPEVQTYPLQNETLGPKDRGVGATVLLSPAAPSAQPHPQPPATSDAPPETCPYLPAKHKSQARYGRTHARPSETRSS